MVTDKFLNEVFVYIMRERERERAWIDVHVSLSR